MKKPPQLCNVLESFAGLKHLWRFDTGGRNVELTGEQESTGALPSDLIAKNWTNLWRRKLNIGWLPGDHVFLRVIQLPAAEKAELLSMLEFQLEKLSPMPVAQIVWTAEFIPSAVENSITVLVVIVSRNLVEDYLGELEANGYLADRLELPFLPEIVKRSETSAAAGSGDGIWIYPSVEGAANLCLVSWWFGGALQNLQMVHLLPGQDALPLIQEQLVKIAWAGEVEGWLQFPVPVHLVSSDSVASTWSAPLQEWAGTAVQVHPPTPKGELAHISATRAATGQTDGNLLPPEFVVRYHQRFVDRLWMKGLGAVLAVYLVGLGFYFGALQVYTFRQYRLEQQIANVSGSYTNTLQLKERVQVLEDQLNLKYAALDCWKAASELLPAELTLSSMVFNRGGGGVQALFLVGTAPGDDASKVTDYNEAMRNAVIHDQPLFSKVTPPNSSSSGGPNNTTVQRWTFNCELKKADLE